MFVFKFVRQEAVGIYYIPWPAKKIAAQISSQVCLLKTAQICAACTANWPKLPKTNFKKTYGITYLHFFYRSIGSRITELPAYCNHILMVPNSYQKTSVNRIIQTLLSFLYWPKGIL